jgi:2-dehydropantoate 2-reductase
MTVAVIGPGAIGGLLAAELHGRGNEVTLCARRPLARLVVEPDGHDFVPTVATDPAQVTPTPWIVVALKAMDSAAATPWLERLVRDDSVVVVVQNGVEHDRLDARGAALVPAIANTAVERTQDGRLVHRAGDLITLADVPGAAGFAALLEGSGLRVQLEADFTTAAWRKLLSNIAGNPLTALTGRRAEVFREPDMQRLALALLSETVAVGRAEGARLDDGDAERTIAALASLPPDTGSSMLYDRLAGRPLEVEPLVGVVVRAARRHGIDAPRAQTLYALLSALAS